MDAEARREWRVALWLAVTVAVLAAITFAIGSTVTSADPEEDPESAAEPSDDGAVATAPPSSPPPPGTLAAYGHSFLVELPGHTSWLPALAAERPDLAIDNRGYPGHRIADTFLRAWTDPTGPAPAGTDGGRWTPGDAGAVVVDAVTNDALGGGDDPEALAGFESSLRSLLHLLGSSGRVEQDDAAFVYSEGWQPTASPVASGGTLAQTTTPGASAEVRFDAPGAAIVLSGINEEVTGVPGAVATIGDGEGEVVEVDLSEQCRPDDVLAGGRCAVAVAVPGRADGPSVVRVTHDGPDGSLLEIDALLLAADEPPTVVVVSDVTASDGAYALAGGGATDDTLAAYREVVERVAAAFDHVVAADAAAGWDPSSMLAADGLHLNADGADHYAGIVAAALRAAGV